MPTEGMPGSSKNSDAVKHRGAAIRIVSSGMRAQLDASSFQGPATFGIRPLMAEPEQLTEPVQLTEPGQLDEWQPDAAIAGCPWNDNTANRPGARFGPRALRDNAYDPGTHHFDLGAEFFDHRELIDYEDAIRRQVPGGRRSAQWHTRNGKPPNCESAAL